MNRVLGDTPPGSGAEHGASQTCKSTCQMAVPITQAEGRIGSGSKSVWSAANWCDSASGLTFFASAVQVNSCAVEVSFVRGAATLL